MLKIALFYVCLVLQLKFYPIIFLRRVIRVLDIGHIDSEYEWMKMGVDTKVKLHHKHTAEHNFDQDIEFIEDEAYNSQVLTVLS